MNKGGFAGDSWMPMMAGEVDYVSILNGDILGSHPRKIQGQRDVRKITCRSQEERKVSKGAQLQDVYVKDYKISMTN